MAVERKTVEVAEVAVRAAEPEDAEAIATVHASAWQTAFTFLPSRFLEAMTASAVLGQWQGNLLRAATPMFVAVDDGSVVGFLQVRADGPAGEVMSLYVTPESWDQGVGSTLLAFGETWLASHGVETAVLWTARDSPQSRGFYEGRGWAATGDEQTQYLGPTKVALHEVRYQKSLGA